MEVAGPALREPGTRFHFPDPEPLPSPLVTFDGVDVGYGHRPVLRRLTLTIGADDRIARLGAPGNGKSPFLKILLGSLRPISGQLIRPTNVHTGPFLQEQGDYTEPSFPPCTP